MKWEQRLDVREGRMLDRETQLDQHAETLRERILAREKHLDSREARLMERERMLQEKETRSGLGAAGSSQVADIHLELRKALRRRQMLEVDKALAEKQLELAAVQNDKRRLEQEARGTAGRSPAKQQRVQQAEASDLMTLWSQDVTPTARLPAATRVPRWSESPP
eukprot:3891955-Rhodomonas_salina.1